MTLWGIDGKQRYRVELPGPGTYSVLFASGGTTAQRSVAIAAGAGSTNAASGAPETRNSCDARAAEGRGLANG